MIYSKPFTAPIKNAVINSKQFGCLKTIASNLKSLNNHGFVELCLHVTKYGQIADDLAIAICPIMLMLVK